MDRQTRNRLGRLLRLGRTDAVYDLIREAAAKLKPAPGGPVASRPPRGINPLAVPLWRDVLARHGSRIYAPKDAGRQWGLAVIAFVKACEKREIEPYLKGAQRALRVHKALKLAAKNVTTGSKVWRMATVVRDFHAPRIELVGRWGWEATITVDLRLSPCVKVAFSDAEGGNMKRTFGRGTVDEVNLDDVLTKVLNWLQTS